MLSIGSTTIQTGRQSMLKPLFSELYRKERFLRLVLILRIAYNRSICVGTPMFDRRSVNRYEKGYVYMQSGGKYGKRN